MNLNYWLPWRSDSDDSKDSTYEDEVIRRCDHDFEQTVELQPRPIIEEGYIEDGYLVFPQYELVEEFCTKCGEPGLHGEANPYGDTYQSVMGFSGEWTRVARKLVIDPDFVMGPDCSVSDAVAEPVEDEETEMVRYVNQNEQDETDALLVPDMEYGVTD